MSWFHLRLSAGEICSLVVVCSSGGGSSGGGDSGPIRGISVSCSPECAEVEFLLQVGE